MVSDVDIRTFREDPSDIVGRLWWRHFCTASGICQSAHTNKCLRQNLRWLPFAYYAKTEAAVWMLLVKLNFFLKGCYLIIQSVKYDYILAAEGKQGMSSKK